MQLTTKTKGVEELERLETEINSEAFEAFYHIGQKLLLIKRNELYREVGYSSWSSYCASGRIEHRKAQADYLIRASELRPKLPEPPTEVGDWSVKAVSELCKCETDNDAKRVAKKAIAVAEKTKRKVTAKLIAEIRDSNEETGNTKKKLEKQLEDASMDENLNKLWKVIISWNNSLQAIDLVHWESASRELLQCVLKDLKALTTTIVERKGK